MHRRRFLETALLGAAAASCGKPPRPPNIVFVMLDDLGYGDIGCYGQKLIRTPHLDAFARESIRFTDAYAGSTVCAPSRCALMTGMHTGHGSVRTNAGTMPLLASDRTVASALREAGYATGGFGKWGLGDFGTDGVPWKHGFDEFSGYLHQVHAHNYYTDFLWENGRKFPLEGNREGKGQHTSGIIAEKTFDFVRRHRDVPFFLYACWTLPHGRYEMEDIRPYENEDWSDAEKVYAAMITRADAYFGELLALLEETGLARDTVVFFTSDNGGVGAQARGFNRFASNGPWRGAKGNLYEGGIRVPMMVRWPGIAPEGREQGTPWAFYDFFPTACEIAGAPVPPGLDGRSVVPLLRGEDGDPERRLYWEFFPFDFPAQEYRLNRKQQAVRAGRWKAVKPSPDAPTELYDLPEDPGETRNLAEEQLSIAAGLTQWMEEQHSEPRIHDGPLSLEFVRDPGN